MRTFAGSYKEFFFVILTCIACSNTPQRSSLSAPQEPFYPGSAGSGLNSGPGGIGGAPLASPSTATRPAAGVVASQLQSIENDPANLYARFVGGVRGALFSTPCEDTSHIQPGTSRKDYFEFSDNTLRVVSIQFFNSLGCSSDQYSRVSRALELSIAKIDRGDAEFNHALAQDLKNSEKIAMPASVALVSLTDSKTKHNARVILEEHANGDRRIRLQIDEWADLYTDRERKSLFSLIAADLKPHKNINERSIYYTDAMLLESNEPSREIFNNGMTSKASDNRSSGLIVSN